MSTRVSKRAGRAPVSKFPAPHFEFPDTAKNRAAAITMYGAARRAFATPGPHRLEGFTNSDARFALSQELEAKQTPFD